MRPRLQLLDRKTIGRVLDEALQLLRIHGVKVRAPEVVEALASAGAQISDGVARIPEAVVEQGRSSQPRVSSTSTTVPAIARCTTGATTFTSIPARRA